MSILNNLLQVFNSVLDELDFSSRRIMLSVSVEDFEQHTRSKLARSVTHMGIERHVPRGVWVKVLFVKKLQEQLQSIDGIFASAYDIE